MTSCPACALPTSRQEVTCAFCGTKLPDTVPTLGRLTRLNDAASNAPEQFSLTSGETVIASARRCGGSWQIDTGFAPEFKLVSINDESGHEIVLFDGMLNVVATVRALGASLAPTSLLLDSADKLVAVIRADGSGGLHVMAPDGNILMFAGRSGLHPDALDLLITDAGAAKPVVVFFAAMVGLEAEKIGPLHVAPRRLVLDGDAAE